MPASLECFVSLFGRILKMVLELDFSVSIGSATKWLRILSIPPNDIIRDQLVADPIGASCQRVPMRFRSKKRIYVSVSSKFRSIIVVSCSYLWVYIKWFYRRTFTFSTALNTRMRFRPANFWMSFSNHPRANSSANNSGYLLTSSKPAGVLKRIDRNAVSWKSSSIDNTRITKLRFVCFYNSH